MRRADRLFQIVQYLRGGRLIISPVTGARMLRAWGGVDMAIAAEEALIKIQSVLPAALQTQMADVRVFSFVHQDMDDDLRHRLDFIETAIKSSHRLIITYRTGEEISSQRTIRPLCQLFWGRIWTVLSWCELRDDYRSFRVDRIQDIETSDAFKPDTHTSLKDFLERERTQAQEKVTHFNAL